MTVFCTQVHLSQRGHVRCHGGLQQRRTFQESRQGPPAVGLTETLLLTLTCCGLCSCSAQVYLAPRAALFQEKGPVAERRARLLGTW